LIAIREVIEKIALARPGALFEEQLLSDVQKPNRDRKEGASIRSCEKTLKKSARPLPGGPGQVQRLQRRD